MRIERPCRNDSSSASTRCGIETVHLGRRDNDHFVRDWLICCDVGAPARAEEQTLSTTPSLQSDYGRPVTIAGGTLHSEQSAGMNGERRTVVTYEVSGDPDDANTFGPHLVARVIHDSGAVMVCKMGESERLRSEPGTYYLGCDRLVDPDKVEQWSAAELISCERIEVFEELFRDHPCGVE